MTTTLLPYYNRQQYLKTWKPFPSINLSNDQISYYEHKIEYMCNEKGCHIKYLTTLIDEEAQQSQIDANFVKYVAIKHMNSLINYIKSKGLIFTNIEYNIKQIINEILTNQVDENYYLNTIDIYEGINGTFLYTDIYDLINQAIRLDNKRMLYYLILKEDEDIADRVFEVIRE